MSQPPVFIVGAPRSGTTLLRNMLNRHPRFSICRETRFYHSVYSRRRAFGDLSNPEKRRQVVEEYLATERIRKLGVDLSGLRDKLMREATDYRALFTCFLEYYAEFHGKPRCGEKTPYHAVFTETLCEWYPGASIIHLVRDPRDVVASLQRMPWASNSVVINASSWVSLNRAAQRSSYRPGYLLVHYETLLIEPEGELTRICAHLGEQYAPSMLVPQEAHVTYNWWSERARMPLMKDRLGKWKGQLTEEEVALIEWVAGRDMARFEYQTHAEAASLLLRAQGLTLAAGDAVRSRIGYFPAVLYRLMRPTKLSREEFWVARRIRKQERSALDGGPSITESEPPANSSREIRQA